MSEIGVLHSRRCGRVYLDFLKSKSDLIPIEYIPISEKELIRNIIMCLMVLHYQFKILIFITKGDIKWNLQLGWIEFKCKTEWYTIHITTKCHEYSKNIKTKWVNVCRSWKFNVIFESFHPAHKLYDQNPNFFGSEKAIHSFKHY